jgi:hypothetical protein
MNPNRLKEGKKRAQKILKSWRQTTPPRRQFLYTDDSPIAKRLIRTRKPCSCPFCGNPRRHFNQLTRQEIIANSIMQSQIHDFFSTHQIHPFSGKKNFRK